MTSIDQWGVPLAVMGMLLATLFMASVAHRHQAHQTAVRARVRRLEVGLNALTQALDALAGVPLSRELRVSLRGEILIRYQHIRGLYRRFPGIDAKLRAAEAAMNAEGGATAKGVGPIETGQALRRLTGALDELTRFMARGDTLKPLPRDVRAIFRRELCERRAEAVSRYHLVAAKRFQDAGNFARARSHLVTLTHVLRRSGPSTAFVRELHGEAEGALNSLAEV